MKQVTALALFGLMLTGRAGGEELRFAGDSAGAAGVGAALPIRTHGRVVRRAGMAVRQWPGTYWETGFTGTGAAIRIGPGDVSLRVTVDGGRPRALVRPRAGFYRIDGLAPGAHRLRVQVVSESQAGPTAFGGIYALPGTVARALPVRARRIEFIGDSHTVGYGNTSGKNECTQAEVWETTDTAQGVAGQLAAAYRADYRVNAISGRGVVRNYNGGQGDTLPKAYPFALLDHDVRADDAGWRPQLIVVSLGTNDFSTPLHNGERWAMRDALHADYEARYMAFVRKLRAAHPGAFVLLWATDMADGEIATEGDRVAERLRAAGDRRVAMVRVNGLRFAGCHGHPDVADDRAIAGALSAYVDAHPEVWRPRPAARAGRAKR